jgi:hypothetical protein
MTDSSKPMKLRLIIAEMDDLVACSVVILDGDQQLYRSRWYQGEAPALLACKAAQRWFKRHVSGDAAHPELPSPPSETDNTIET